MSVKGLKRGPYKKDRPRCTRCGAPASVQKWNPKTVRDMATMELIENTHFSDGVYCKHCGTGFNVSRLETEDGTWFVDLSEQFEADPSYCPFCGERMEVHE